MMRFMKFTLPGALGFSAAIALAAFAARGHAADPALKVPVAKTAAINSGNADETAIRASADSYEKAYAAGDAKALAEMFVEDGQLVDEQGRTFIGRDAIAKEYTAIFANQAGAKVEVDIESIKFLTPEVAIETGTSHGHSQTAAGPPVKYTAVHVKRDGDWKLSNVNESNATTLPVEQRLASLSFLVGEWKADLGQGKTYELHCEWTAGHAFMKRMFWIKENGKTLSGGTQVIGYDPIAEQIVSWTFDSSGGYGHEIWENHGSRWRIMASSVLPDGSTSLAFNHLTTGGPNNFTWQSTDRSLNNQLLPDTALVRVQRTEK